MNNPGICRIGTFRGLILSQNCTEVCFLYISIRLEYDKIEEKISGKGNYYEKYHQYQ
jgi:hypothetical protein